MDDQQEVAGIALDPVSVQIESILDKLGELDTVRLFNPLSVPFRGKFARTVPQNAALNEQDKRMAELGAPVTKQGGGVAHTTQFVIIPAGDSLKLYGYAAKVVGKQLMKEIIQRQYGRNKVADPATQRKVEEEIILNWKEHQSAAVETSDESFERELRELNDPLHDVEVKETVNEPSFPTQPIADDTQDAPEVHPETVGVSREDRTGHTASGERTEAAKKPVGHPKAQAR